MINSKQDWWDTLERAWDGILLTTQELGYNLEILATDDLTKDGKCLFCSCLEDLIKAKKSRNWERVHQYLQAFWAAAPDRPWIHSLPNWGDICDLCSETWVFNEER